jgi:hypothetical protein
MAADRTVVMPSTSFALALPFSVGPVVIPKRPEVTASSCRSCRAIELAWGSPRNHTPLVAVSVPNALTFQPRWPSKSSLKGPQWVFVRLAPTTDQGHAATCRK